MKMTTLPEIKNQLEKKNNADGGVGLNSARGYHLEFTFKDISSARELCDELAQYDIFAKLTTTVDNSAFRVYIKDKESICNLLALVGANKSLYKLHDQIVMRSVRNTSNRRANCDSANIDRQIKSAHYQIEKFKDLKNLPPQLQQTVDARLSHPDATYDELAAILGISKSGVVHRIKKVLAISK